MPNAWLSCGARDVDVPRVMDMAPHRLHITFCVPPLGPAGDVVRRTVILGVELDRGEQDVVNLTLLSLKRRARNDTPVNVAEIDVGHGTEQLNTVQSETR